MADHSNLHYIIILLAVAVIAIGVLRRVHLPAILAYLFTGILVGPHGLGWIPDTADTRVLAEFGVVFLLFTLGLEFSLPRLMAMKREVLALGGGQVVITSVAVATIAWLLGATPATAFVLGGAFGISSTAIVAKQLSEQLELNLRHGRLSVGVLLFQDLAVIPFLIIIPALGATASDGVWWELAWALAKGLVALAGVLVVGRWLLRPLFHEIANSRSAELFTLAVLLFSLTAAWATHALGLSLALGAFLAGMMLGETEFRHQVEADIRPFRDVLLGLFFITVGMLVDVSELWERLPQVVAILAALLLLKAAIVAVLSRALGYDWPAASRTGIILAQCGEFGFALLTLAIGADVMTPDLAQTALATVVLSMVVSPILIRHNGKLVESVFTRSEAEDRDVLQHDIATHQIGLSEHVIICGFGRVGQNVARFLEEENTDYIALDLDPVRVRAARTAGDPVYFGDSARLDVLRTAGLERARVVVISFFDVSSSLRILSQVKKLRPEIPVLVRTRDDSNLEKLQEAGATEVIPETLEASLMLVSHLLLLLDVPMRRVVRRIQDVRDHRYSMMRNVFRGQDAPPLDPSHAFREQLHTVTLPSGADAVGRTIGDLNLDRSGVTVTAVRREGIVGRQPGPETRLREGDVLVLYGTPENLEHAESIVLRG